MMKFAFINSKPRKLMFYNCRIVKPNGQKVLQFGIVKPKKRQIVRTDLQFTLIRSRFSQNKTAIVKRFTWFYKFTLNKKCPKSYIP